MKLFRTIRATLLEDGKSKKYLKYAIGEILLVVIGILIALQINNWNEYRKEKNIEKEYLIGIKEDIEADIPFINRRMGHVLRKVSALHSIDSAFNPNNIETYDIPLDSLTIQSMFNRGPGFRMTTGSYSALISNASAGLIKNAQLLQSIQTLYDHRNLNIRSIYEDLKTRQEHIGWKYAKALKSSNIQSFFIDNPNRTEVLADFDFFYQQQALMYRRLRLMRTDMLEIIDQINAEIE